MDFPSVGFGDFIVAVAGILGIAEWKHLRGKASAHDKALANLPEKYVPKEEYREDLATLQGDVKKILLLLGAKEDR